MNPPSYLDTHVAIDRGGVLHLAEPLPGESA